jgi:hypothetical protein
MCTDFETGTINIDDEDHNYVRIKCLSLLIEKGGKVNQTDRSSLELRELSLVSQAPCCVIWRVTSPEKL